MHWGTFGFGYDKIETPLQRLDVAWQNHVHVTDKKLSILKVGQTIGPDKTACAECTHQSVDVPEKQVQINLICVGVEQIE